MKKILLFLLIFSSPCGKLIAQKNILKIGPSLLLNTSFFDERVYPAAGIELSIEHPLSDKLSLNVAGSFHYGRHKNIFDLDVTVQDFLTGIQPEIRYHFNQLFEGFYLGAGGDAKYLVAKHYFPPIAGDEGTLADWEINTGVSFGHYQTTAKGRLINPLVYIGFNAFGGNEYELHARLGLNIGIASF